MSSRVGKGKISYRPGLDSLPPIYNQLAVVMNIGPYLMKLCKINKSCTISVTSQHCRSTERVENKECRSNVESITCDTIIILLQNLTMNRPDYRCNTNSLSLSQCDQDLFSTRAMHICKYSNE